MEQRLDICEARYAFSYTFHRCIPPPQSWSEHLWVNIFDTSELIRKPDSDLGGSPLLTTSPSPSITPSVVRLRAGRISSAPSIHYSHLFHLLPSSPTFTPHSIVRLRRENSYVAPDISRLPYSKESRRPSHDVICAILAPKTGQSITAHLQGKKRKGGETHTANHNTAVEVGGGREGKVEQPFTTQLMGRGECQLLCSILNLGSAILCLLPLNPSPVPRERPPARDIVQHDSQMRGSGSGRAGDRARIAVVGGEHPSHCATTAPSGIYSADKSGNIYKSMVYSRIYEGEANTLESTKANVQPDKSGSCNFRDKSGSFYTSTSDIGSKSILESMIEYHASTHETSQAIKASINKAVSTGAPESTTTKVQASTPQTKTRQGVKASTNKSVSTRAPESTTTKVHVSESTLKTSQLSTLECTMTDHVSTSETRAMHVKNRRVLADGTHAEINYSKYK
ncbi:hypothetical protein PR048_018598 [Dryococelus australis]|uniref:Uncharacterized protein n=1 Tax=Dryococelus australis TaxID=614101 RepID=A0ABQ9HCV3_9NEOP|nr:hypothetical protein PR048_018598 [Dryococelus australis]